MAYELEQENLLPSTFWSVLINEYGGYIIIHMLINNDQFAAGPAWSAKTVEQADISIWFQTLMFVISF